MASDDTRPKIRMLLTVGIVSVFILLGLKFLLDSYYYDMTESYEHSLLPKTELLDKTRTEQHAALESSPIPVNIAMQTLASKGRDNADPAVTPQPSDDIDPLKGWAQMKHEVHLPPQVVTTSAPIPPPPPATATAKDGGARMAPTAPKDGGH